MSYDRLKQSLILCISALIFTSAAFAADGAWRFYPAEDPFASRFGASAGYKNGYDEFAIRPVPSADRLKVYVAYWEKDLAAPTRVTARLTMPSGQVGVTEFELRNAIKDWTGTTQIRFALRYDDLVHFKRAVSYELDFGDKVLTIPMEGFDAVIDRAVAQAN